MSQKHAVRWGWGVIFTLATVPLQAKQVSQSCGNPEESAIEACGSQLKSLCRSFHSLRKLPDQQILVVGGKYGSDLSTSACDALVYDPKSEKIKSVTPTPKGVEVAVLTGFRVNDRLIGFSNRPLDLDPNDLSGDTGYEGSREDTVFFWDATAPGGWIGQMITADRYSHASTPALLKGKDKAELIRFTGAFVYPGCAEDDVEHGVHCERSVDISADGQEVGAWDSSRLSQTVQPSPPPKISPKPALSDYGTLRRARIQFDTVTFSDGRIFVVGGKELVANKESYGEGLGVAETAEYYLPTESRWLETPPLPEGIFNARAFMISNDEILVVNMGSGKAFVWSFAKKAWRAAFAAGMQISRAMMHSTGVFVALAAGGLGENEKLLLWHPGKNKLERIPSALPFREGAGLVELADHQLLEVGTRGIQVWNLKKKSVKRIKH